MSQEEEDQLLGRAIREKAQAERKLAILAGEMERLAKGLSGLQNDLMRRSIATHPPSLSIAPEVSRYMECSKLLALIEDQDELFRQIESLSRVISGAGSA